MPEALRRNLKKVGETVIRIRRALTDTLMSIAALTVLLAVLVAVNDRVRQQVSLRLTPGQPQADVAAAVANIHTFTAVAVETARSQTIAHAPLVIFVTAACVLVVFMLRV